ncbi:MAG: PilX N-terminal domain-containing pilus assembly protein [Elusimicrobiota bacterium]
MRNFKNNKGMALVGTILLMMVVVVLGSAMMMLTWFETKSGTDQRLSEKALYVADAGVERAIYRLRDKDDGDFTINVGTATGSRSGVAEVFVTKSGSTYTINSTGYVPSKSRSRGERAIRARIKVSAGLPQYATLTEGQSTFNSNTVVRGVIYSSDKIFVETGVVFKPDSEGNVALYGAYDGGQYSIDLGNNFDFDPDNNATGIREILARNEIWNSNQIPDDVHWEENDTSEKTDPIDDYEIVDAAALIAEGVENYDFGGDLTVTDGRANFESGNTYDLNGGTYYYPNGINIDSNVTLEGDGNFVVGPDDNPSYHGINVRSNVSGDGRINWVVAGDKDNEDEWKDGIDINMESNVDPVGIIQCPGDANLASNVEMTGMLAVGGDLEASSNVEITYSDDMFMPPLKDSEYSSGIITVLSWSER